MSIPPQPDLTPPSESGPPPPAEPTWPTATIAHERVVAGVDRLSDAAAGTGALLTASVRATFHAAASPGEKLSLFGSTVGLLAFLLPWADEFGGSISGFGLAERASGLLFFLPISLLLACLLCYLNIKASLRDRVLRARWLTLIGAFWAGVTLLLLSASRLLFGVAAFGLYLSALSVAALALGGCLQTREHVTALADVGGHPAAHRPTVTDPVNPRTAQIERPSP